MNLQTLQDSVEEHLESLLCVNGNEVAVVAHIQSNHECEFEVYVHGKPTTVFQAKTSGLDVMSISDAFFVGLANYARSLPTEDFNTSSFQAKTSGLGVMSITNAFFVGLANYGSLPTEDFNTSSFQGINGVFESTLPTGIGAQYAKEI